MILLGSMHRHELERLVDEQLNLDSVKSLFKKYGMGDGENPLTAVPAHMRRTESETSCESIASVSTTLSCFLYLNLF